MAGFAAEGIQGPNILTIKSLDEYRGVSYGAGGDPGAVTVPNFIKRYSPALKGSSVAEHLVEICYGLICPPFQCMFQTCRLAIYILLMRYPCE